jgi:ectoine hydroxylase-related dioxygenase (phytanoyl-CoA dioxygenase family)
MIESYNENGFLLSKNILSNEDLAPIRKTLSELVAEVFPLEEKGGVNSVSWVEFSKTNPDVIADIYNKMRDHFVLKNLGKSEKIRKIINKLIDKPGLYKKIPFRIDVPFETKELAYWHQDDYYVGGGSQDVTVWIPLYNTKIEHGCLKVMPRSHKLGPIPHTLNVGKKTLPRDIYDREVRYVEMDAGDVLFFSSYLLHSSSLNFSDQIRYSIQLRYTSTKLNFSKNMLGVEHV